MMACANAALPTSTNLSNHHQKSNGVERADSLASASTMSKSLSTPDLIAALTRLSKNPITTTVVQEENHYITNLDALSSQRHSSLNSDNDASVSLERTNSRSSRNNELTVPPPNGHIPIESNIQTTSNGSLVSFSNVQLMHAEEELLDGDRRISLNSMQSDAKRNLLSLQTVGRTLRSTHNHLKRTRLLHVFYFLSIPIYTIIGALIFQYLDGQHDDLMIKLFKQRCIGDRAEKLLLMETICNASSTDCFKHFKQMLSEVDTCYREWQDKNHTITHSMSELTNAIVYAFSVYTSIGYGTVSASTFSARLFTVFYAALGIPLFFAFVKVRKKSDFKHVVKPHQKIKLWKVICQPIKEEGNQCRIWFVRVYNYIKRCQREKCCWNKEGRFGKRYSSKDESEAMRPALLEASNFRSPLFHSQSSGATHDPTWIASDQRRIFVASVVLFVLYLLFASYMFSLIASWNFFNSFYFTFSSVALIGFGDLYPQNAMIVLGNIPFIVIGVVLFSMCYFTLQEEIRVKAFEASRKARMSISKYSHSLMLHASKTPWSRRNSPAFDQNDATSSNNSSKRFFERNRKRRQSAPAIHVQKMDDDI